VLFVIEALLEQDCDDGSMLVAFFSHHFLQVERAYEVHQREVLAMTFQLEMGQLQL
jgi:hypothetical protein